MQVDRKCMLGICNAKQNLKKKVPLGGAKVKKV